MDPRRLLWHVLGRRRLAASFCAAAATVVALEMLAPAAGQTVAVLAAARDLAAGTTLTADDLSAVELPMRLVPDGALMTRAEVLGRVVAGRVRRGEPLTDARLAGASTLGGAAGLVAVPVRLADPGAALLLGPGDRVDVLAAASDADAPSEARVVATGATVVTVPAETAGDLGEGALVVLAVPARTARVLAAAAARSRLSVVLRPR